MRLSNGGKEICDRRDELFESQQKIKHRLWKLEREICFFLECNKHMALAP